MSFGGSSRIDLHSSGPRFKYCNNKESEASTIFIRLDIIHFINGYSRPIDAFSTKV